MVKETVSLPIKLVCGSSFELVLFVTPLAEEYPVVLGHSWLKSANPTINWTKNTLELTKLTAPERVTTPPIALIGAAAFKRACCLEGSLSFQLAPTSTDRVFGRTSVLSGESAELKEIPKDYKEYVDVFNKNKAKQLLPHCNHDLSI